MQLGEPAKMQSSINVTPLVDVVLVLLIIFMVVAPQMQQGPPVDLPETARPRDQGGDGARILVTIDQAGELWIDAEHVASERFREGLVDAAGAEPNPRVVIQGDARLRFGEVRRAMLAVEQAGFHGVGLIAERGIEVAQGS